MSRISRVLVVDDHAVVRAGCRQLLETWEGFVVEEAATAAEAVRRVNESGPDLVILDINLPDRGGLDLIAELIALAPCVRILIFSMHDDSAYVHRALERGAHGFVTKSDSPDTIVEAARRVVEGEVYLSQPVAQRLALARLTPPEDGLDRLTRREREAVGLFGQGKTLAEIAEALGVSYKTVANTLSTVKGKLDLSSSAELMRIAVAGDKP
jgi:DNA-binding NarL/FixJ family response regulator